MKKTTLLLLPCFCMTMPLLTATPHVPHAPHDAHATHEVHATHATHAVAKGYHEAGVSKAHTVKGPKNTEAIEATEATEAKSGVSEKAQDIKNSHEIQGTPMENVKTAPRAKADI